jgi:hypothetical protein
MTADAFTASLKRSAAQHPPSKARRIAALWPEIEAAMARGSPRAHIVTALLDVGIEVTPHLLSNVIARLRKQRADTVGLSAVNPVPRIAGVPTLAPVLAPALASALASSLSPALVSPVGAPPLGLAGPLGPVGAASKFGAHDPRLLDEVMRSTPDMKALAKLAPRSKT